MPEPPRAAADRDREGLPRDFVAGLRCPRCGGPLAVLEGEGLTCRRCGRSFPVRGGIPRFVDEEHLASFGLQWNTYEVARDAEDRRTFRAKTGVEPASLRERRVLDAGCGGGRYSKVAGEAGARVVGADGSRAVETAARLCGSLPNVRFLQADLKHLPLEPASFDFVFSMGVMHHDADPRAVFNAVARMVRPGGRMAVWLYRRNRRWQERLNDALRGRTTRMPAERLQRWCRLGAWLGGLPLVNRTLNKVVNFSNHPRWENRLCDTFDWYAPRYQHHHTLDELCGWFREAGFGDLVVLPPEKTGRVYRWAYEKDLIVGSGVNVVGTKRPKIPDERRARAAAKRP